MTPRTVALLGLLAAIAGVLLNVGLVLAGGGGLTGYQLAGRLGAYAFYIVLALVAIGWAAAAAARRPGGVSLMLTAALFEVGYLIGSEISITFLVLPLHR